MKPVFMKNFVLNVWITVTYCLLKLKPHAPISEFHKIFQEISFRSSLQSLKQNSKDDPADQCILLNTKKQHGCILTLVKQHFHYVRVTLPGGSVQWGISEFILKHKTWLLLANTLTSIKHLLSPKPHKVYEIITDIITLNFLLINFLSTTVSSLFFLAW